MKIILINGSPRGKDSSCSVMLSAFVKEIGKSIEMVSVNLSEKSIQSCRGCYNCWTNAAGCGIEDDFKDIIKAAENTDLIVFATPVYFGNVSGLFKNFIDRLTSTGNPHSEVKLGAPKFVMMANCGFPDKAQFEIISLWINRFVKSMRSELLGEFYFEGGKRLKDSSNTEAQKFLGELTRKGEEIAGYLSGREK